MKTLLFPSLAMARCKNVRGWTYGYSPIDDESIRGGVGGVLVVCNDVTVNHETMEALRINRERLQLSLDAGVIGTWDWHVEEDKVFANARFADLYGVDPAAAARGVPLSVFVANIHPEDIDRVDAAIQETLKGSDTFSQEYRLIQADDSIRWVLARGHCQRGAGGEVSRFPGAVIDITDRKEAERHSGDVDRRVAPSREEYPCHRAGDCQPELARRRFDR